MIKQSMHDINNLKMVEEYLKKVKDIRVKKAHNKRLIECNKENYERMIRWGQRV